MNIRKIYQKDMKARLEKFKFKSFEHLELTTDKLDKIFKEYYVESFAEWYFDSEPEDMFSSEEYHMFLDYACTHPEIAEKNEPAFRFNGLAFYHSFAHDGTKYSNEEHTDDELKIAFDKVCKAYRDYEEDRLKVNNWIELFEYGVWSMNASAVQNSGKDRLYSLVKIAEQNDLKDIRFTKFNVEDENIINLYCFFRDTELQCDYPITLVKKDYYIDYDIYKTVYSKEELTARWNKEWETD